MLTQAHRSLIFVSIVREEHAPILDLQHLVNEDYIGDFGFDIYEDEPNVAVTPRTGATNSHPLARFIEEILKHPQVVFTPYNAFNTIRGVQQKISIHYR
jgi:lactate dehydrogenase-like 2-hydroxyacid dehydrogenase